MLCAQQTYSHYTFLCHVIPDVSAPRATSPLTRTFPFPSHVTLTVLVCVMATRLDSSLSCLRFLAYASYSSPDMSTHLSPGSRYAHMLPGRFVSRLPLRFACISVLYSYGSYARLYLYCTNLYIYWVGDGTLPIFNLLCNHPSVVT